MRPITLKALAIAVSLSFSTQTFSAYMIPGYDPALLAAKIKDDMSRAIEWAKKSEHIQSVVTGAMETGAYFKKATNNNSSNIITRLEDVQKRLSETQLLAKMQPVHNFCEVSTLQENIETLSCNSGVIYDVIADSVGVNKGGALEAFSKARKIAGSVFSGNVNSSSDGTEATRSSSTPGDETETNKQWEAWKHSQAEAIARISTWNSDGKLKATNPSLLTVTNNYMPYSEEELDMAITLARVAYPPYIRKSGTDPVNEMEVVEHLRKQITLEETNSVINRHIGLRTAMSEGELSNLAVLTLPAELAMDPDGSLGLDSETRNKLGSSGSWLEDMAINEATTTEEIERQKTIMKAQSMKLKFEAYKSSLMLELMLIGKIREKLGNGNQG